MAFFYHFIDLRPVDDRLGRDRDLPVLFETTPRDGDKGAVQCSEYLEKYMIKVHRNYSGSAVVIQLCPHWNRYIDTHRDIRKPGFTFVEYVRAGQVRSRFSFHDSVAPEKLIELMHKVQLLEDIGDIPRWQQTGVTVKAKTKAQPYLLADLSIINAFNSAT